MSATLPRITARIDSDTQEILKKAAALAGVSSINSFVLNAALEKAKQLIEREQMLKLTQEDAILLMQALDEPTTTNSALQQAAKDYHGKKFQ